MSRPAQKLSYPTSACDRIYAGIMFLVTEASSGRQMLERGSKEAGSEGSQFMVPILFAGQYVPPGMGSCSRPTTKS